MTRVVSGPSGEDKPTGTTNAATLAGSSKASGGLAGEYSKAGTADGRGTKGFPSAS